MNEHHIIRPGDLYRVRIPGIAREFLSEVLEVRLLETEDHSARLYLKALHPVVSHDGTEILYTAGTCLWLTTHPPDGYRFAAASRIQQEDSDTPDPQSSTPSEEQPNSQPSA